jgi:Fe-Mn family superoxide dismutase
MILITSPGGGGGKFLDREFAPKIREERMSPSKTIAGAGSHLTRRDALKAVSAAAAFTWGVSALPAVTAAQQKAPFAQLPLPYPEDALEPVISGRSMSFHYGKHHKAYYDNLNKLIEGTDFVNQSLEDIIRSAAANPNRTAIFNNAGQASNHAFFWQSMKPGGGGTPSGAVADRINASFGSFDACRKEFATAAATQFGSGWAWLVQDRDGKLLVMKTANADTPVVQGLRPLLTLDVWEHAYYLDYQNRRSDFIEAWLDKLVNWEFAAANLAKT